MTLTDTTRRQQAAEKRICPHCGRIWLNGHFADPQINYHKTKCCLRRPAERRSFNAIAAATYPADWITVDWKHEGMAVSDATQAAA